MLTSKDIQFTILEHWLLQHHCPYVCSNFSGAGYEEADCLCITSAGIVNEFEVKVSRSDFFADFKKVHKHQLLALQSKEGRIDLLYSKIPNKFTYAVPKGLVKAEEVPKYAGLMYFTKYQFIGDKKPVIEFEWIKKPPMIHKLKAEPQLIDRIARTLSQRLVLGCALLTYKNRLAKGIEA